MDMHAVHWKLFERVYVSNYSQVIHDSEEGLEKNF